MLWHVVLSEVTDHWTAASPQTCLLINITAVNMFTSNLSPSYIMFTRDGSSKPSEALATTEESGKRMFPPAGTRGVKSTTQAVLPSVKMFLNMRQVYLRCVRVLCVCMCAWGHVAACVWSLTPGCRSWCRWRFSAPRSAAPPRPWWFAGLSWKIQRNTFKIHTHMHALECN